MATTPGGMFTYVDAPFTDFAQGTTGTTGVQKFQRDVEDALGGGSGWATNVTLAPYNADNTGATDASAAIQTAINDGNKRIYLPAGTYLCGQTRITSTTRLIDFSNGGDGLELFGDGEGRTIITVPSGVSYNSGGTEIININGGKGQSLHDLSLLGPASVTSIGGGVTIVPSSGALRPHIYNIEIANWSSAGGAGAAGISLYRSTLDNQISTTLGTAIAAGTRTVTPASMAGIYKGRLLKIHGLVPRTIIGGLPDKYFFVGKIHAIAKYDNVLNGTKVAAVSTALASLSANWWTAGSSSGLMFAYQPKGAATYAASKTDLSTAGNNASDGPLTPAWDTTNGWTFVGGETLTCAADSNRQPFTAIVRFNIAAYPANAGLAYSLLGSVDAGMQFSITEAHKQCLAKSDIARLVSSTTDVGTGTDVVGAITYDGTNYVFYLNGTADGSGTSAATFTGDAYEVITVTGITLTTFDAVFASAHGSSDAVTAGANSYQGAVIERFNIHDMGDGTGIVINSSENVIQTGKILKCGQTTQQHGLYVQGGFNIFDDITIEGCSGYHIHQYPTSAHVADQSGNIYNRINSINPGTVHALVTGNNINSGGDVSDGFNELLPTGSELVRYTQITNCLFRDTNILNPATDSLTFMGAVLFDGNVLEDIHADAINSQSAFSIFTSNNVSRKILRSTVAQIPVNIGGGIRSGDSLPDRRQLVGQSAYWAASTNVTGGNVELIPGWGIRKFTALDNLSGGVSLTVSADPQTSPLPVTIVSGTDFNLGSDNSAGQLNLTAKNIGTALYNGNVYQYAEILVSGPNVYLLRNPAKGAREITLTTTQSGRVSVTQGANGTIQTTGGLQWMTGTKPTAGAAYRGMVWYVAGAAGVADTFEVCVKSAGDTYSWTAL